MTKKNYDTGVTNLEDQLNKSNLYYSGWRGTQLSNAGLDPAYGHNEGPFGALGKMLAAARGGPMLQQGVQAATAGNMAAMPDLAKLLASPDPYTALSGNIEGTNPVAAARLLNGAMPEDVAKARLATAQAAFQGARTTDALNKMKGTPTPMYLTPGAGAGVAAPSGPSAISGITTGRPEADPVAEMAALPPDQRAAKIGAMTPQQKLAYIAALKKRGSASAARPGT